MKYIIESFVGCISDMELSSGKAASDLLPIVPLIATKHENVKEGCIDKCRTMENLCFEGSRCINEYNGYRCDCFGTLYEEQLCDVYSTYLFIIVYYLQLIKCLYIICNLLKPCTKQSFSLIKDNLKRRLG